MQIKYIIIPIATISCGKTTTFQTLVNLFPSWVLIQNDDLSKNRKKHLVDISLQHLIDLHVIMVDKNNSGFKNRAALFTEIQARRDKQLPGVQLRFIGVNFIKSSLDKRKLWEVTSKRTKLRGDNHLSIKYDTNPGLGNMILRTFIKSLERVDTSKLPDSQFDLVIELDIERKDSSLLNVGKILSELSENYAGFVVPSREEIETAFEKAMAVQVL